MHVLPRVRLPVEVRLAGNALSLCELICVRACRKDDLLTDKRIVSSRLIFRLISFNCLFEIYYVDAAEEVGPSDIVCSFNVL